MSVSIHLFFSLTVNSVQIYTHLSPPQAGHKQRRYCYDALASAIVSWVLSPNLKFLLGLHCICVWVAVCMCVCEMKNIMTLSLEFTARTIIMSCGGIPFALSLPSTSPSVLRISTYKPWANPLPFIRVMYINCTHSKYPGDEVLPPHAALHSYWLKIINENIQESGKQPLAEL